MIPMLEWRIRLIVAQPAAREQHKARSDTQTRGMLVRQPHEAFSPIQRVGSYQLLTSVQGSHGQRATAQLSYTVVPATASARHWRIE